MKSQIAYYLITSLAPVGCARTSWFRMSSCTPPIYSYTGCPAYWAGSSNKLYYTTDDPVSLRYIKLIPKGLVHAHRANNIGQCQVPNPNNYIKCGTTWNVTWFLRWRIRRKTKPLTRSGRWWWQRNFNTNDHRDPSKRISMWIKRHFGMRAVWFIHQSRPAWLCRFEFKAGDV